MHSIYPLLFCKQLLFFFFLQAEQLINKFHDFLTDQLCVLLKCAFWPTVSVYFPLNNLAINYQHCLDKNAITHTRGYQPRRGLSSLVQAVSYINQLSIPQPTMYIPLAWAIRICILFTQKNLAIPMWSEKSMKR